MMPRTIIIVVLLIALVLGGFFVLRPEYQEFKDKSQQLEVKELELKNKEKYFSELRELESKLGEYSLELDKIDSALPAEPSIPDLFNFLEKMASQNGLILTKISLEKISSLEETEEAVQPVARESEEELVEAEGEAEAEVSERMVIKEISTSLFLSGSYSDFKNFLSVLQKNARLIEPESISFSSPASPEEEKKGREIFTFDLMIKTYSY